MLLVCLEAAVFSFKGHMFLTCTADFHSSTTENEPKVKSCSCFVCLELSLLPVPDDDGSAVTGLVAALLLVLIGVGVILLVLRKRRNNGKNEQPVCQHRVILSVAMAPRIRPSNKSI